ncbi:MAG: hypothetical protein KGM98_02335, partial [Bacteroidota bacterium]|nr:hypothetical protein [Bacteroidota bacterium]
MAKNHTKPFSFISFFLEVRKDKVLPLKPSMILWAEEGLQPIKSCFQSGIWVFLTQVTFYEFYSFFPCHIHAMVPVFL